MQGNKFYVQPASTDITPVLTGIGSLVKSTRDAQKRKENEDALMNAYQSGDPDAVAGLLAKRPELAPTLSTMLQHRDTASEKEYSTMVRDLAIEPDQTRRADILATRIDKMTNDGRDSTHSQLALSRLIEDPAAFEKGLDLEFARTQGKQAYDAYKIQKGGGKEGLDAAKLKLERDKFNQRIGIDKRIQNRKDEELKLEEMKNKQAIETNKQVMEKRELEIEKLTNGIAQKKSDIKAGYVNALATSDSTLSYIEKLLEHPGLDKTVGVDSIFKSAPGSDAANFESLLETFDAKLFTSAIKQMVGMGSLSDAEGKKISASVGALNIKMSNVAFRESLADIKTEMDKARNHTISRMEPEDRPLMPGAEATGQAQEGQTATNPQTGQKVILTNGQWQPAT